MSTSIDGKVRLYELALADGRSASPFVWRIRYALAHKGLSFESVPLGFTQIPAAFNGRFKTVPVLESAGTQLAESWDIAGGQGAIKASDGSLVVRQSDQVHQQIDHLLRSIALTAILAGNAPVAMCGMKRAINEFARGKLDEAAADLRHRESMRSAEIKEGIKASAEKRPPRF